MIAVIVCATIAFVVLGLLAADLWRAHLVLSELEAGAAFDRHTDQALDVAADPDREDFRLWSEQIGWPEYKPRFRPWIEPEGHAG